MSQKANDVTPPIENGISSMNKWFTVLKDISWFIGIIVLVFVWITSQNNAQLTNIDTKLSTIEIESEKAHSSIKSDLALMRQQLAIHEENQTKRVAFNDETRKMVNEMMSYFPVIKTCCPALNL